MPNVRKIAYDVLTRVLNDGAYSVPTIGSAIKEHALNKLDASFLSALCYGVLERMIALDYIIRQYSNIRLKKIEFKTLLILRLGVYQMIYMDKVPSSAAVNESVKLCKKLGLYKSSGFVNAVLRNLDRAGCSYTLPDESDTLRFLSVKYSCPEEIVSIYLDSYSREISEDILRCTFGRPPITIRVNTLRTTPEKLISELSEQGITAEPVPFLPNALNIAHTGAIDEIEAYRRGEFYVQDASSQLCCEILDARAGETVCDVCAAPGGKSFTTAIRMQNEGAVYSYDIHAHKVKLMADSAERLGLSIVHTELRDAESGEPKLPLCDRLLCDVPCSGLGIIRRKPEIRYKKDTYIDILPKLQYSILCMNSVDIPIGGIIVYSTCTLNRSENGDIVDRFLREHPDFEPLKIDLPDGYKRAIDEPAYMLTILPSMYGSDGFFIAKFRRVRHD